MFSLFPILLAVLSVYAVLLVLSLAGAIPEENAAFVSFGAVDTTPWIRGFTPGEGGVIFPWGTPLFPGIGFMFAILAAYLASTIESFGDYHAISRMAGAGDPDAKTINRGIGFEGVGCFLTGVFGGFSSTSYSENIGLVGLTKVASRAVVLIGAAFLLVFGLIAKFGAVIASIPTPIVGGVYLALFGLIAAVGLSNLRRADMDSQRNLMIVGFLLFMGLVVPNYFNNYVGDDWSLLGNDLLTSIVQGIGSSGIAVAAILGPAARQPHPGHGRRSAASGSTTSGPSTPSSRRRTCAACEPVAGSAEAVRTASVDPADAPATGSAYRADVAPSDPRTA
jgi:solute carrier family 23 (nucleobase transporter), member 1